MGELWARKYILDAIIISADSTVDKKRDAILEVTILDSRIAKLRTTIAQLEREEADDRLQSE